MKSLEHYLGCFRHLRRGVTPFGPAPHKLILLLTLLDEAERGHLPLNRIALTEDLERRFATIWQEQITTGHRMSLSLPFFHLQHDGFWYLHARPGQLGWLVTQTSVSSLNSLRNAVEYASLEDDLFDLLGNAVAREQLRQTLLRELARTEYGAQRASCPFCHLDDRRPLLAENELAVALLDAYPVSKGHTLIIPRRHVADCFSLEREELLSMQRLSVCCRELLRERHHPDGFNLGFNVGAAAGQTVFHCHMHLIPRYLGDVPEPRGGVRGVIPSRRQY